MGIFDSVKKSKFIKHAMRRYKQEGSIPVDEIFEFIQKTEPLSSVATDFDLTKDDLKNITLGMIASGSASEAKGHFTPISGLLFPDTLAYLLRGQRGQISKCPSGDFMSRMNRLSGEPLLKS